VETGTPTGGKPYSRVQFPFDCREYLRDNNGAKILGARRAGQRPLGRNGSSALRPSAGRRMRGPPGPALNTLCDAASTCPGPATVTGAHPSAARFQWAPHTTVQRGRPQYAFLAIEYLWLLVQSPDVWGIWDVNWNTTGLAPGTYQIAVYARTSGSPWSRAATGSVVLAAATRRRFLRPARRSRRQQRRFLRLTRRSRRPTRRSPRLTHPSPATNPRSLRPTAGPPPTQHAASADQHADAYPAVPDS